MGYTTSAAMETWLGTEQLRQLSNLDQSAEDIDTDAVDEAIAEADSEINAHIGARYDLPLSSPYPELVVGLSRRIARYRLWSRQPSEMPAAVAKDYEAALATLKMLGSGAASLGLDTAGSAVAVGDSPSARIRSGGSARRLTREKMRGF